jgi:tRNA(adenine34) deaminase
MAFALDQAQEAFDSDEVPVGAVLVTGDDRSFRNRNRTREQHTPSAHAEALVIESACRDRDDWRLEDCTLYSTLEPCLMCAGMALIARIPRIVFGARDHRFGAFGSVTDVREMPGLNHYPVVVADFMPDRSAELLKEFFRKHR